MDTALSFDFSVLMNNYILPSPTPIIFCCLCSNEYILPYTTLHFLYPIPFIVMNYF
uniref:Uncharacterized protein n=1 Tax=Oryza brachyantha TaxID=4533 RepID=J3MVH2_ORYBR